MLRKNISNLEFYTQPTYQSWGQNGGIFGYAES